MNTTVDNFDNIGRNTPYRVPQDYFDKQRERLLSIADTGNKRRRITLRRVLAVASAAVIFLGMSLFTWHVTNSPAVNVDPVDAYMSSLSDDDLAQAIDIADNDIFFETDSITNY